MATPNVPEAGDMAWLQFDPQAGREQAGPRPAVVLSPASHNGRAGMMLCCPTTTLGGQVQCQDWRARNAVRNDRVSAKLRMLIG